MPFEEMGKPGIDICGAAVLCAPPDLSQIIVVTMISFVLHGFSGLAG
jgi:hypothetical protein